MKQLMIELLMGAFFVALVAIFTLALVAMGWT